MSRIVSHTHNWLIPNSVCVPFTSHSHSRRSTEQNPSSDEGISNSVNWTIIITLLRASSETHIMCALALRTTDISSSRHRAFLCIIYTLRVRVLHTPALGGKCGINNNIILNRERPKNTHLCINNKCNDPCSQQQRLNGTYKRFSVHRLYIVKSNVLKHKHPTHRVCV